MLDSFSFRGFRSETNEVILSCIVVPDSLAIAAKDKDLIVGSSDNRGKALGRTVKPCTSKDAMSTGLGPLINAQRL